MIWLINLLGLALMLAIVWWFWIAKPATTQRQGDTVDILVDDGVYTPSRIETPVNQPITLRFLRKDASPCAEQVIFSDFDISAELPVDDYKAITLTPQEKGEYDFTCQMQMYRGTLIVI
ncbi:cupredoxin domain-containing protein [Thiohalophilus sp.]|uniref:cupredoxin domain-containing protein n=1 Tax=Thiohalophilus sp. TaxID=3028392 RepID=UPI002ACE341A|nr:cupredoxin domain-containing protein [Thiohalophilus sp.]MDZ7661932.1 cupredoxin domain-containing protein [Thiohalophilus sp.]MDZ7803798.1 cupredoxin domain-containing protein [Thiohalophilus sp.]